MCFLALLDGKLKFNLCSLWLKFLCNLVACYVLFSNAKHYSLASPGLGQHSSSSSDGVSVLFPPFYFFFKHLHHSRFACSLCFSVCFTFLFCLQFQKQKHANTVR